MTLAQTLPAGDPQVTAGRAFRCRLLLGAGRFPNPRGVRRNGAVVPRSECPATLPAEGDRLETGRFVGGG